MIRWLKQRRHRRRLERYRTQRRIERREQQVVDIKHVRVLCSRLLGTWDNPTALAYVVEAIDLLDEALRILEPDGYRPDLVAIPHEGASQ